MFIIVALAFVSLGIHSSSYAITINADQKKVLDKYCSDLHDKVQSEELFVSTSTPTDNGFNREKIVADIDAAQYQKICGNL